LNGDLYTYNDTNNFESPTENYSYDAVGNRTASHLSASYSYQPFNKLTSTANTGYVYDNNGNLTSKTDGSGTTTFSYDEENRLKQVTLPVGLTVSYAYDGLGRRILRSTSAGANERYVYDGNDVLIDLNADWSVGATYLNGLGFDNHLRQTSSTSGVSYFLTDHLGSTAGLSDINGNILEQQNYDSFGNGGGSGRTRYGYTGRERDPDTVSTASATYSFDANGNLVSKTDSSGTTTYAWDFENRLKQVTLPNGNVVTYKYDALGRRIARTASVLSPLPLTHDYSIHLRRRYQPFNKLTSTANAGYSYDNSPMNCEVIQKSFSPNSKLNQSRYRGSLPTASDFLQYRRARSFLNMV